MHGDVRAPRIIPLRCVKSEDDATMGNLTSQCRQNVIYGLVIARPYDDDGDDEWNDGTRNRLRVDRRMRSADRVDVFQRHVHVSVPPVSLDKPMFVLNIHGMESLTVLR